MGPAEGGWNLRGQRFPPRRGPQTLDLVTEREYAITIRDAREKQRCTREAVIRRTYHAATTHRRGANGETGPRAGRGARWGPTRWGAEALERRALAVQATKHLERTFFHSCVVLAALFGLGCASIEDGAFGVTACLAGGSSRRPLSADMIPHAWRPRLRAKEEGL